MSYTKVKSSLVKAACTIFMAERDNRVFIEREAMILKQMTKRFFKSKTRADAIAKLKEDPGPFGPIGSEWDQPEIRGGHYVNIMHGLLTLAQKGEEVIVSLEDMAVLAPYLQEV